MRKRNKAEPKPTNPTSAIDRKRFDIDLEYRRQVVRALIAEVLEEWIVAIPLIPTGKS